MNCLIFEPDVTGHRLQHVRHLADALLEIGCRVTIALQVDCRRHTEFEVHLRPIEPHVRLHAVLGSRQCASLVARRRRVAELTETIASLRPEWVYVPYADGMTQAAALEELLHGRRLLQRVPIEAQIMRGKYGYPQQSPLDALNSAANRWLTRRSPWRVTHVLDPFAREGLEPLARGDAFRLIPEPVEPLPAVDRQTARRVLGVPPDGRYLAFVGGAHPRKGIDLLLAAFSRAKISHDDRLLFVGKMTRPIHDLVHQEYGGLLRQNRLVIVDRYVSDYELDCGFLAADIVAVAHPRQIGSSGTLVRAAAAERPVLAADFGWIAWATTTFRLGATVSVSDTDRYAEAIEQAFASSDAFQPSMAGQRFCDYHTIANQKAHWVDEIGRSRGIPLGPLATRIGWEWVLEACERPATPVGRRGQAGVAVS